MPLWNGLFGDDSGRGRGKNRVSRMANLSVRSDKRAVYEISREMFIF